MLVEAADRKGLTERGLSGYVEEWGQGKFTRQDIRRQVVKLHDQFFVNKVGVAAKKAG